MANNGYMKLSARGLGKGQAAYGTTIQLWTPNGPMGIHQPWVAALGLTMLKIAVESTH